MKAPPSMGFSRQEYWSGLSFSSPGDLPDPGIELRSPTLHADSLTFEPPGNPIRKAALSYLTQWEMGKFLQCYSRTQLRKQQTNGEWSTLEHSSWL